MSNPERIYIRASSVTQALKDGTGTYYPNFTGDATQFDLVAYVPESKVTEEIEAAFKEAVSIVEKLVCHAQFDGNWRNGYSHAQNDAFRALEAAATENRKGEG